MVLLERGAPFRLIVVNRKDDFMGSKLYVGNLSYDVTEKDLRELFEKDGRAVSEIAIVMDRDTGRPKGFAFVTMGSDADAQKAASELDGHVLLGRPMKVNEARDRGPRGGGGGGGGGGRGPGGGGGRDRGRRF
jgi:RNA recognition motif-containing protein